MNKIQQQKIFNAIIEDNIDEFKKEFKLNPFDLNHIFSDIETEDGLNSEHFNLLYMSIDWHSLKILNFLLDNKNINLSSNTNIFKDGMSPFSYMLLRGFQNNSIIKKFLIHQSFFLYEKDKEFKDFREHTTKEISLNIIRLNNEINFKKNIKD